MMNAFGRRALYLQNDRAAIGVGITGVIAAFFISRFAFPGRASPYNDDYHLRNAPASAYS